MIEFFRNIFKKETEMSYFDNRATIRQMKNGRFRLLANVNEVVGTYNRRRDAVRGAKRKGLVVA